MAQRTVNEPRASALGLNGDGETGTIGDQPRSTLTSPELPIPIPDAVFDKIQAKHLQKENSMLRATLEAIKLQSELDALMQDQLASLMPPGRVLSEYEVNQAGQVLELLAP